MPLIEVLLSSNTELIDDKIHMFAVVCFYFSFYAQIEMKCSFERNRSIAAANLECH